VHHVGSAGHSPESFSALCFPKLHFFSIVTASHGMRDLCFESFSLLPKTFKSLGMQSQCLLNVPFVPCRKQEKRGTIYGIDKRFVVSSIMSWILAPTPSQFSISELHKVALKALCWELPTHKALDLSLPAHASNFSPLLPEDVLNIS
jgi:hypothetical protein